MASIYTEISQDIYRAIIEDGEIIARCGGEVAQGFFHTTLYKYDGYVYAVNVKANGTNDAEVVFCNRLA